MYYDPSKPTLIPMGLQKLGESWDGSERRSHNRPRRDPNWKFKEVKLPTYQSNDATLRRDGYYPAGY